jgi:hypothetical protein
MREVEQFCEHPKFPKSSTTIDKSTMVVRLVHYTTQLHNNTKVLEIWGFFRVFIHQKFGEKNS